MSRTGRASFYLNRTNRFGVLNAGVIGGKAQQGKYRVDARLNRVTLTERLAAIGSLSAAIEVSDVDGRSVILRHGGNASTFRYIAPPRMVAD